MRKIGMALLVPAVVLALTVSFAAGPTGFGQTFCDGFDFGHSGPAGQSPILKVSAANSQGNAYSDTCGGTQDGTYTWMVQHGQINSDSQFGTEHGTFTFTSGDNRLGAIFNGLVEVYVPVQCSPSDQKQANVVYQSSGQFNSLNNNPDRTGSDSTFHAHGSYAVTVTADNTSGAANCHFEATLTGLQN